MYLDPRYGTWTGRLRPKEGVDVSSGFIVLLLFKLYFDDFVKKIQGGVKMDAYTGPLRQPKTLI